MNDDIYASCADTIKDIFAILLIDRYIDVAEIGFKCERCLIDNLNSSLFYLNLHNSLPPLQLLCWKFFDIFLQNIYLWS